jgi:hypothetical protein
MTTIPAYIINLKRRTDRKDNILKEFAGREEFIPHIVEAFEEERGAMGLWITIKHILQDLVEDGAEFILICEDDHQFTGNYSKEALFDHIAEAAERKADILCGGVSWFEDCLPVSEKLFSIQKFSGLQFTIIFKKIFDTILHAPFGPNDVADYKIAALAGNKFVIHPFISVQKDYGYSDATPTNTPERSVERLFEKSDEHFRRLKEVYLFYKDLPAKTSNATSDGVTGYDYSLITLPVYIIHSPERPERRQHIEQQFSGRSEFDVSIVTSSRHAIEAVGLWLSIRNILQMAIDKDDDVIIICQDNHEFSRDYSAEYLVKNIIEAHEQGTGILLGGVTGFGHAVPITENRFWVNPFWSAQFIVLYKQIFPLILNEPFDEKVTADGILSEITSNKMVIFPFISLRKDFGSPDHAGNSISGPDNLFTPPDKRLLSIQQAVYM